MRLRTRKRTQLRADIAGGAVGGITGAAPTITPGQSFSYAENKASGFTIGTVLATDAVGVTGFRFLATGTGTSADGNFAISSAGVLTLTLAGSTSAANDFETLPNTFSPQVQAGNAAGNWSPAVAITINVTDVAEGDITAPVVTGSQSFSYAENKTAGFVIGTVLATDAVGVTQFRFTATGTSTSSDGFFSITNAGVLSLTAAGAAGAANDFEAAPNSFTPSIQAGDAAGNWSAGVAVTINVTDVDDTAPVVTAAQSFSYAENQAAGFSVGTVLATDAVGVTAFRFTATGTGTSADGFYTISSAGVLTLTSAGAASTMNDFDDVGSNSAVYGIQAQDAAGNWSASVNVTINVADVDDAAPVVTPGQSFTYGENQVAGFVVGTVAATDNVAVTGFRFTATATNTSADGFFSIANSGAVSLTSAGAASAANDFETSPNSFTYGVQARDAVGNWSASVNVILNVADVDDTAPVVAPSQSISYAENQAAGATLGTVSATDAVGVTGFRFTTTATGTSSDGYYSISSSGVVTLTSAGAAGAANDFEVSPNSFTHSVQARDAAGNWSAGVNVSFIVTDVVDTSAMLMGVNTNYAVYTGGATPFANLMWNAEYWQDKDDASNYWVDQDQHNFTGNTSNHVLVAIMASSTENLPAGTYTVRNPDGKSIGFGDQYGSPNLVLSSTGTSGYTTATAFTFTLTANAPLAIFTTETSITNTGGTRLTAIQVILPGHVTSWDAGDYFNSAWVSYQQTLGTQAIRTMDWLGTNTNIFDTWSEMPTLTKTGIKGFGTRYPLEIAIAAANRLNKPLWLNMPVRFSDAAVTSAAALMAATYTPAFFYLEYANEVWNIGNGVFGGQTNWVTFITFTKKVATCSGTTFSTATAHGFSNGQEIRPFLHKASLNGSTNRLGYGDYWLGMGQPVYVKVLSSTTFEIWSNVALSADRANAGTAMTQILYVDPAEAGKTAAMDTNYSVRAKQMCDIFDTAMGSSKVKLVIGTHNATVARTNGRFAVSATAARANFVAPAPYHFGLTMGAAVDRASGQFTPKFWSTSGQPAGDGALTTVRFRVYTTAATPRNDEIKAGTGTGYMGGSVFTQSWSGAAYTSGAAVTGLTNTTNYKCYIYATDPEGNDSIWSQTIQATASADTVDMLNTYANHKQQALWDVAGDFGVYSMLTQHREAAQLQNPACQLACYEGGNHQDFARPAAITAWWEGFLESSENADLVKHYLYAAAAADCKLFMWYYDIGSSGPWTLADSNYDTGDLRFLAVSSFAGSVPKYTKVNFAATVDGGTISADPVTYPYTAYTFVDSSLTYSIVDSDDDVGNFDISGASVRLVSQIGVSWGTPSTRTLKILATDGKTDDFFNLVISLGSSWFENDAFWALDMTTQASLASLTPAVGNALTAIGTGGAFSGGMLDLQNTQSYDNSNATTGNVQMDQPICMSEVMDVANATTGAFQNVVMKLGANPTIELEAVTSASIPRVLINWFTNAAPSGDTGEYPLITFPSGKHVVTILWEPSTLRLRLWIDLTEQTPVQLLDQTAKVLARKIQWYGNVKIGSSQYVRRTGLTAAYVTGTIIPKMKTKHGIT